MAVVGEYDAVLNYVLLSTDRSANSNLLSYLHKLVFPYLLCDAVNCMERQKRKGYS